MTSRWMVGVIREVQLFEQCFILFDDVVHTAGVSWNVNFNTIVAVTPVWESILKVLLCSVVSCYY